MTEEQSALYEKPVFRAVGDTGLLVEYGRDIDPEVNRKVRAMALALDLSWPEGLVEVTPTYRSLLLNYDPLKTGPDELAGLLAELEGRLDQIEIPPPERVEIPVCYGGELGPDLAFVAEHAEMSPAEVIRLHSGTDYLIYMLGFTPGFPYLGGLDERLATPRLRTPRTRVEAGSVGIANQQTGMYPVASPGGWQLIGRTPLKLFAPERERPFLYRAGDLIRFKPVDREEFDRLALGEMGEAG